jgi:hypothetical protein
MLTVLTVLTSMAFAEPPPYVSLADGVAKADHVVVATPVQVEFETLKPGEVWTRTTLDNPWIAYRIDEVIKGTLEKGQVVRAVSEVVGCELADVTLSRKGDQVVETMVHSSETRVLDPAVWRAQAALEPVLFLADGKAGEPRRALAIGDRIEGEAGVARVRKAAQKAR